MDTLHGNIKLDDYTFSRVFFQEALMRSVQATLLFFQLSIDVYRLVRAPKNKDIKISGGIRIPLS